MAPTPRVVPRETFHVTPLVDQNGEKITIIRDSFWDVQSSWGTKPIEYFYVSLNLFSAFYFFTHNNDNDIFRRIL